MRGICEVKLCGRDNTNSYDLRDVNTVKKLDAHIMNDYSLNFEKSERLFYHFDGQSCHKMMALEAVSSTAFANFASKKVSVHVMPSKSAYTSRVEDIRASKEGDVSVRLRLFPDVSATASIGNVHFTLPYSTRVKDLRLAIKPQVIAILQRPDLNNSTLLQAVQERKSLIWYYTGFCSQIVTDTEYLSADDGEESLNIDTVSDLFRKPRDSSNILKMRVHLVLKPFSTELATIERAVDPRKKIVPFDSFRLGTMIDPIGGTQFVDDKTEVKVRDVLIAQCDKGKLDQLEIYTIPAYDFDDFCIGNCNTSDGDEYQLAQPSRNADIQYLSPYQSFNGNIQSFKNLKQTVKELASISTRPLVGNGIPIIPPYTFNTYDAAHFGMANPSAEEVPHVRLAIRCEHSLEVEGGITFPPDLTMEVEPTSTAYDIRNSIIEQLSHSGQYGRSNSNVVLREEDPTWNIELWALPQEPAEMKLYLFAKPDDETGDYQLIDFLNRDMVRKNDCRLFMMAHIAGEGEEPLITGVLYDPAAEEAEVEEKEREEEKEMKSKRRAGKGKTKAKAEEKDSGGRKKRGEGKARAKKAVATPRGRTKARPEPESDTDEGSDQSI